MIGKIITADSNLFQNPDKNVKYYNIFIGEKGIVVYILENGKIEKDIILFDEGTLHFLCKFFFIYLLF